MGVGSIGVGVGVDGSGAGVCGMGAGVGGGIGSTLRVRGVLRSTFNVTQLIPSAEQPLPVDPLGHEQEWLGSPPTVQKREQRGRKERSSPRGGLGFRKAPTACGFGPGACLYLRTGPDACSLSLEVFLPGSLGEGGFVSLFCVGRVGWVVGVGGRAERLEGRWRHQAPLPCTCENLEHMRTAGKGRCRVRLPILVGCPLRNSAAGACAD